MLDITASRIVKYVIDNELYCNKGKVRIEDLDRILTWHFDDEKKFKRKRKKRRECSDNEEISYIFARLEEEVAREFDYVGQIADNMSLDHETSFVRYVIWYLVKMNTNISTKLIARQYNYSTKNVDRGIRKIKGILSVYKNDPRSVCRSENIVF